MKWAAFSWEGFSSGFATGLQVLQRGSQKQAAGNLAWCPACKVFQCYFKPSCSWLIVSVKSRIIKFKQYFSMFHCICESVSFWETEVCSLTVSWGLSLLMVYGTQESSRMHLKIKICTYSELSDDWLWVASLSIQEMLFLQYRSKYISMNWIERNARINHHYKTEQLHYIAFHVSAPWS